MLKISQLVENKLKECNKKFKPSGEGFLMTTCFNPSHQETNPSFSINLETGAGFCFSCGHTVSPSFWGENKVEEVELDRMAKYNKLKKNKAIENPMWTGFLPPVDETITDFRGLPEAFLKSLGIYISRTGKFANRVIFPIFMPSYLVDVCAGFDSRALNNEEPKYLRSKGFSDLEGIYPFGLIETTKPKRLYVVEGIIDCLSGWVLDIPCICNFGVKPTLSSTKAKALIKCGVEEIVILTDNDKAGNAVRASMERNWEKYFEIIPIKDDPFAKIFYESSHKDLNDLLQDTKGD